MYALYNIGDIVDGSRATVSGRDGSLTTWGATRFNWAKMTPAGKFHRFEAVIIRWRVHRDMRAFPISWEKPNVTFVAFCGPQALTEQIFQPLKKRPIKGLGLTCLRCESVIRRQEQIDGVSWG